MGLDKFTPQSFIPYLATGVGIFAGIGSPNGVQKGGIGSQYTNLTNGDIYVKTTAFDTLTGWTLLSGGSGSGTVTDVGLTANSIFDISGSSANPITTSGTFDIQLATQVANSVLAGPTTPPDAAPTFRNLVIADLPVLVGGAANSIQYNNGANLFDGADGILVDPATYSVIVGKASDKTGNLIIRDGAVGGLQTTITVDAPAANSSFVLPDGNASASANQVLAVLSNVANVVKTQWVTPTSGTLTNFTAGNLSPLFTASVANPTTAPSLTFAQVSQNQNLVFASPDGTSGNPTFRSLVAADLPSGLTPPFVDSTALVKGSVDATKLLRFEVDGFTTATTRVLTPPDADVTIAGQNFANNFTVAQTLTVSSANALAIGPNGNTNPVLRVVTNVASQATGVSITGNAAGNGVTLNAISSGATENIGLVGKSSGVAYLGASSTVSGTAGGEAAICNSLGINTGTGFLTGWNGLRFGWSSSASAPTGSSSRDIDMLRAAAGVMRLANGSTGVGSLLVAQNGVTALANLHVEPTGTGIKAFYINHPSGTTVSPIQVQNNLTDIFVLSQLGKISNRQNNVATVRTIGQVNCDVTDHNNSGTSVTDLASYSMPANFVGTNTDSIRSRWSGIFASNANGKQVIIVFGTTTIFDTGVQSFNGESWTVEATISRVSATSQRCIVRWQDSGGVITAPVNYIETTEDLTTILAVKSQGKGGATNDVTNKIQLVEVLPA